MKVAFITMTYPVESEAFANRDVRLLRESGVDVEVFSLRPKVESYTFLMSERLEPHEKNHSYSPNFAWFLAVSFTLIKDFKGLIKLVTFILSSSMSIKEKLKSLILIPRTLQIVEKVLDGDFRVVHLFWGHFPALAGYLIKKRDPSKIVTSFLGAYDLELSLDISRKASPYFDLYFTHSSHNLNPMRTFLGTKQIKLIYRGVEVKKDVDVKSPRKDLYLSVGRLTKEKGHYRAIELFKIILKHSPGSKLEIIGDGPEKSKIESYIEEQVISSSVRVLGYLPHKKVLEKFETAKGLIFCSYQKSERNPNVIKEAMANGCVPISILNFHTSELVSHGGAVTFENYQREELERAASEIANGGDLIEKRVMGRNYILRAFNAEINVKEMIQAWNAAIQSNENGK